MKLTGENRSTQEKTCPSATLSTTNPTWTAPGSNPSLAGERPATNRLSHGTALMFSLFVIQELLRVFHQLQKLPCQNARCVSAANLMCQVVDFFFRKPVTSVKQISSQFTTVSQSLIRVYGVGLLRQRLIYVFCYLCCVLCLCICVIFVLYYFGLYVVLFLLLATWLWTQHVNKQKLN